MKRFSILLGLVLAMSLVFVGAAYANFGPHGGYISDTDSCAGCHRAHSSASSVTFEPKDNGGLLPGDPRPSALLVGDAATMTEFCNACHGDTAPGASTNVVKGVFDAGPSAPFGVTPPALNGSVATSYSTDSTFDHPLNGGGFDTMPDANVWETSATVSYTAVTSAHSMEQVGVLWGAGSSVPGTVNLNCTSCHDPHGSSNYRLLKDSVNDVAVGGYNADDTPKGIVFSTETNYPTADRGWKKHSDGQIQMAAYKPNYTSGSTEILGSMASPTTGSLSTWCSACHTGYNETSSTADYGSYEGGGAFGGPGRHRHPVDITVKQGDAVLQVPAMSTPGTGTAARIPLEVSTSGDARNGQIGCLTCHFAHGSTSKMSGWSAAHLTQNAAGTWVPTRDATPGVDPDKVGAAGLATASDGKTITTPVGSSALLRADNRGVCERCHNK